MSLRIGVALSDAAAHLVSRTGAVLLAVSLVVQIVTTTIVYSALAWWYASLGLADAARMLPLTVDVAAPVLGAGYLVVLVVSLYSSVVAVRTFVAGAGATFPDGAFTRNVPLAMVNLLVGGLTYSLVVAVGSLLVVPGLVAYVAFLFMLPIVAVEDRNFVDALRESYRRTKGHWVRLFALMVVVVALSGFLGGVIGLVTSLLLPYEFALLAIVLVQTPVSLYTVAVIASAYRQLQGGTTHSLGGPRAGAGPA
ncbi:hypothetical protein [Haloarcula pellucida]|uniref:DUF7847 domain-containing protein n=1 Tax=Haloarcula pellucida TaxID=1427151 RepID=A0A830GSU8_9EURY|nr:hypothetical protein [Halomicroarcula pellucida]MBX0350046.1 hypothetical protein [Halomicroarcula pellucida]GGO00152.1 hypothetical protein GCM10009030_32480 [Halomicroarcula pellucida]